jgi:hypothetical protein
MDVTKIDLTTLQATIASVEQVVDQLVALIPGPTGDQVRTVVQFVELLANNPAVLQVVLFILSKVGPNASAEDVKNVIHGFDVNNVVA